MKTMNKLTARLISNPQARLSIAQPALDDSQDRLEVNVIFTSPRATVGALQYAESLAQGLKATIRLRAAIVVPWQLPLDEPPVSVACTERLLSNLVSRLAADGFAQAADLYICRDWRATLLQVLDPNSPVIIGRSSRWWPGPESGLAKALRSKGYRVIVANSKAAEIPSVLNDFAVSKLTR